MTIAVEEVKTLYEPRGSAYTLFLHRDPEIILTGPAGTGKSRAILEKVHLALRKYPGARGLMLRKTRRSLTESGMVTFEQKVLHPLDGVRWHSGKQEYLYPNGSILAVGGLDKASKVLSSEWDIIYIQECNEIDEGLWETCGMRLRNGKMPYQQLLGDCNPDSPAHWIRGRVDSHRTVELVSYHEDNPRLFDDAGVLTEEGTVYLARLDSLTGVRYLRYRRGLWVAAEGMVYEDVWNREKNIRPRREYSLKPETLLGNCGIDKSWPRYLGIDWGFTHPFVCRWYAEDPDGRLVMYREIYMTHRLVEDHAETIKRYSRWGEPHGDPIPYKIFCDHDAEDRHTLERHIGMHTTAANKDVSTGIESVASRLRQAGDGKPRLIYLEDSTVEYDPWLAQMKLPTKGVDEIEGYVWDSRKEAPVKDMDHACDTDRYVVASLDLRARKVTMSSFKIY